MRQIIISRIKAYGWLDYLWREPAVSDFESYEAWLNSLDDVDLLDAYIRVHDNMQELD